MLFDPDQDQAFGLRRMVAPQRELGLMPFSASAWAAHAWRSRSAQLAPQLRALGARPVVMLDAPRQHVATGLGLDLQYDLLDYLHGAASFDAVAGVTPDGVHVLRAEQGLEAFVASGAPARQLYGALAQMTHGFDVAILAMPADELACMAEPLCPRAGVPLRRAKGLVAPLPPTLKQLAAQALATAGSRWWARRSAGPPHADPAWTTCTAAPEHCGYHSHHYLNAEGSPGRAHAR